MSNVIEVAAAVIVSGEDVFVAQRKKSDHLGGFWEFPGGKIETGESAEQALHREIDEEFCMQIKIVKLLSVVHDKGKNNEINLHAFLCEMLTYPLQMNEHDEIKWVKAAELERIKLAPADLPLVKLIKPYLKSDI